MKCSGPNDHLWTAISSQLFQCDTCKGLGMQDFELFTPVESAFVELGRQWGREEAREAIENMFKEAPHE